MVRSLKSALQAAWDAVDQIWLRVPTPLRRFIVLLGLILLWIVHSWLGYGGTMPMAFMAVLFSLPIIWIWSRQRSWVLNAVIIALMFWFGTRSPMYGSAADPDVIMKAMFWALLPWYGIRLFRDTRASRRATP